MQLRQWVNVRKVAGGKWNLRIELFFDIDLLIRWKFTGGEVGLR